MELEPYNLFLIQLNLKSLDNMDVSSFMVFPIKIADDREDLCCEWKMGKKQKKLPL